MMCLLEWLNVKTKNLPRASEALERSFSASMLDQIFVARDCLVPYRMLSNIPGPYPHDGSNIPPVVIRNRFPGINKYSL